MKYELTFLLNEEAESGAVKELIESLKGKIEKDDSWGKKTLAYPVKKFRSAFFFHWIIEIDKKLVMEFKKKLNFNDKIMRYLLLIGEE